MTLRKHMESTAKRQMRCYDGPLGSEPTEAHITRIIGDDQFHICAHKREGGFYYFRYIVNNELCLARDFDQVAKMALMFNAEGGKQ